MEIKYLSTFKMITEAGGFAAAAERLNYTQSTITFQIDRLEEELGVKLFEKVGRKMVLTSAGRELLPYVNEVLSAVERLEFFDREVSESNARLNIGVAETFLSYKLPAVLKEFVAKAPKARLFIRSMNCYEIRNELINGSLDIGIFYSDIGGFEDSLTVYPIASYPVAAVASPATAETVSDFTQSDMRYSVPLIINEPNCIFRQIFERYLVDKNINLDHTIELGSIETIKNLVKNDVGISFLPRFTVEKELENGTLTEIKAEVEHNSLSIVCAHHKNKWVSPLISLFCGLVSAAE